LAELAGAADPAGAADAELSGPEAGGGLPPPHAMALTDARTASSATIPMVFMIVLLW
jgi:hypothetical protein